MHRNSKERTRPSRSSRPAGSTPIFSTPSRRGASDERRARWSSTMLSASRHRHDASARPPSPSNSTPPLPRPSRPGAMSSQPARPDLGSIDRGDSEDGEDDSDVMHEVILAIDMKTNETVGCAYYVAMDEALFLQDDVVMAGLELVETMLLHVQPTTILIPTRSPDKLVDFLSRSAQGTDEDGQPADGLRGVHVLRNVPSAEFCYQAAKEKLAGLELDFYEPDAVMLLALPDGDGARSEKVNKLMRLGTLINLDSHVSIGCAGAVLSDMNRRKAAEHLPDHDDALFSWGVRSIDMFTLAGSMFVNADTLTSLQILRSECHPNSQNQGPNGSRSGAKESLSVYGLVRDMACSPQGKTKLRKMFLRPSLDLDLLHDRQQTIALFLRAENGELTARLVKTLRKVKNIKTQLLQLRKGVDQGPGQRSVRNSVWTALSRFARAAIELKEAVCSMPAGVGLAISSRIYHDLSTSEMVQVGELIQQTIDFEQSQESNRTAIRHGVDEELDELKRKYDGLDYFLSNVATDLLRVIPDWAGQYIHTCTFFPQLGFLTAVTLNPDTGKGRYDGEGLVDDVWETIFVNEGFIYYKNGMMRDLDEQVGDVYCMIVGTSARVPCRWTAAGADDGQDREIEMVHALGVRVLRHEDALMTASDLCGELDSLLALALAAEKHGWVAPRMTEQNMLDIEGGRHALQELVVPSFMPNPTWLAGGAGDEVRVDPLPIEDMDEAPSMLVLTGPNHSGKSIYLKQVALIVYLAHVGSYVPATRATVGLTDRILTRISTRESVSRHESAFAIDLSQAAFSMNFATRRSLILIDEFGKGTDANNGAGLCTALLRHFLDLGRARPKVVAASHWHEMFETGLLDDSERGLAFAHMEMRVDLEAEDPDDKVTYLFRLAPGRSLSSFGTRCAAMNGVDAAVVERAEALVLLLTRNEDLQAACARLSDTEERELELAELVARRFLAVDLSRSTAGARSMLQAILLPAEAGSVSPA